MPARSKLLTIEGLPNTVLSRAMLDCGLIIGKRGAGKSVTARVLFEIALDQGHRAGFVDPMGDSAGIRLTADGKRSRFQNVVIFGGPNGDIPITDEDGGKVARIVGAQNIPFVIDMSQMIQAEQLRFMTGFSDVLYETIKFPILLLIDEAHIFAPQSRGDGGASAMLLNRITRLQSGGRKKGIFLWLMTQRPARINKNVIAGSETLIAMKMSLPHDIHAVDDWLNEHDPEKAKVVRSGLTKLNVGEAFVWVAGAEFLEKIQFPMHTTMDTGKTPEWGDGVTAIELPKIDVSAIAAAFGHALTGDPRDDQIADLEASVRELRGQLSEARSTLRTERADKDAILSRETKLLMMLGDVQMRIGAAIGSERIEALPIDEPFEKYLMVQDTDGVIRPMPREGSNKRLVPAARGRMKKAAVPQPKEKK